MTHARHHSGCAAAAIATALLATVQPATAQSFDCGGAAVAAEKAICNSDRLSGLDERMSRLYDKLMGSTRSDRGRERLRSYQMHFLAARDACGRDLSCIKGAYLDQIEVLSARVRTAENDED